MCYNYEMNMKGANLTTAAQVHHEDSIPGRGLNALINCESEARERLLLSPDTKIS